MKENYIEQYKKLYEVKKTYGQTSIKLYNTIITYIEKYEPKTILDYGCGKSKLPKYIQKQKGIIVYKYDPAIDEYATLPDKDISFIICTDVLQHIPLFDLNRILYQIKNYTNNCFFYINCTRHTTLLPNGEFANCTVYPAKWWETILKKFFNIVERIKIEDEKSVAFVTRK